MVERPTASREGVKGQLPLAESRGGASGGVWGNAPTVPRATSMPSVLNKGAGSEASLPVTKKPSNTVQVTWEATPKESRGRPRTSSVSIALWNYANYQYGREVYYTK